MKLAVSIDLDPLWCYQGIYGLPRTTGEDPVTSVASRRFCQLLNRLGITGTLFVVGKTLGDPSAASAIKQAFRQGYEIGNHTYSHPYHLFQTSKTEIREEIERGACSIEDVTGQRPVGFRAPGYLLGKQLPQVLEDTKVLYDSSMLGSPIYPLAKAIAISALKLFGKNVSARMGDFRESLCPSTPFRPNTQKPWKRGEALFWELPISSILGVPLLGSVMALLPPNGVSFISRLAAQRTFVHLELHGVDFMDIDSDGLDKELGIQRDLKIPWEKKAEAISTFLERLLTTHQCMSLEKIVPSLDPSVKVTSFQ